MNRMLIAMALLVWSGAGAAHAAANTDWSTLLLRQDPLLPLEITTDDGAVRTGYLAPVGADSVGLAMDPGGPSHATIAVNEIVLVRQERSGAARGWRTGGAIGGVGGAAFGVLASLLAESLGDEKSWQNATAPYIAFGVGFAAVGTAACGGLGALIGSGGSAWYALEAESARPWRLEPQIGLGYADDIAWNAYDDLHLRLFAPRRFASWVEAGPDLAWMRLGHDSEDWEGRTASVNDTWQAGVTSRFAIPAGSLEPFLTLGLGWYHREDSWLGTSYGLGVRLGRASAEVRAHVRSTDIDPTPSNSMTTVACGWAFDL